MISFIDEEGKRHNALTAVRRKKAVNGEKSLEGTVFTNDDVLHGIDRGWRLDFEDERYVVTYARPIDNGDLVEMEFDAVHEFFYDMKKSVVYETLNGSNTMRAYLNFIFDGIDYDYVLDVDVLAFEKENFGMQNRLALFNDIIDSTGLEFIVNGRVVRIMSEIGRDLTTIVRKGFNMQELALEKNINDFITYKRGFGAWYDDEDHSKGRLEVEYESPLASIYGRLEGDPVVDERFSVEENLLERVTNEVEDSYSISVQLTMEDLVKAGYKYEQPHEGDYIMAINEDLQYFKRIRIVSYESEFDTTGKLVDHFITCNSIGLVQETENKQFEPIYNEIDRLDRQDHVIQIAANGKNRVFRGKTEPTKGMVKNDVWYKPVGNGELEMYVHTGAYWKLEKVSAGLLAGTLDADVESGDVNLINVNVASIVGETSNFVRSWWNGISDSVFIDSSGISLTRTDGSRNAFLGVNGYEFWLDGKEHGSMGVGSTLPAHKYYPKKSIRLFARNDSFVTLSYEGDASGPIGGYGALLVDGETGLTSIYRNLDMSGTQIFDASKVKTRSDIYESVFSTWSSGESFVGGNNGARLGYYDGTTYYTRFLLPKSGDAELFANLSMGNRNINNIFTLSTDNANVENDLFIGSGGLLYQSTITDSYTGHKPLVIDANGTLGFSVNGYYNFRTFRFRDGSTGTHFFTDINMQGYTISNQSDVRLKKNIKKANVDALREIERLEFIYYEWDREKKPEYPEGVQFGIKAQYSPFLQRKNAGEDSYLSIDMNKHVNLNSKAIQELLRRVELLEEGNSDG